MADEYTPTAEDRFTFGLWTVGNRGRDTFGNETRPALDPVDTVTRLAALGAYGVNFHDDDLVPPGSSAAEREQIVKRFRRALDETGMKVRMATTNLFSNPVFKDGAFTANDPQVRKLALRKTLDAIDLGVELGAEVYVMWGGREGVECDAAKDVPTALDCYAEAINLFCDYIADRGYELDIAIEPKPNEPRGNLFLPTVGHALAFIHELADPDIAEALLEAQVDGLAERIFPDGYSSEAVARLRGEQIDVDALAARGWGHERLDQLVTELLLGVR